MIGNKPLDLAFLEVINDNNVCADAAARCEQIAGLGHPLAISEAKNLGKTPPEPVAPLTNMFLLRVSRVAAARGCGVSIPSVRLVVGRRLPARGGADPEKKPLILPDALRSTVERVDMGEEHVTGSAMLVSNVAA
jgi:hypothetical protein